MEQKQPPHQTSYDDYRQREKDRLAKGLPPLAKKDSVPILPLDQPILNLKIHPNSHEKIESKVGKFRFKSYSSEHPYYVIFKDDGEVAYFFAVADLEEGPRVLDAVQIYNTLEIDDQDKSHLFEIIWSESALQAALLIDHHFHAVFDFENLRGSCRMNFPPSNPNNLFGEYSHEWSEDCMKWFTN